MSRARIQQIQPVFHKLLKHCRNLSVAVAAIALAAGIAAVAVACNTPVYRYATYNWTPSPYRIYFIARGQKLPANDPVRLAIDELARPKAEGSHAVANLELIEIDVAAENPLEALPPPIREEAAFILERATTGEPVPELPRFAVVLPHGYPMYEGPLTPDDIRAIANSPARQKLVEMMTTEKAATLVLLEGDKPDDNAAAEKLIAATIERAAAGELSPPPDPALTTEANAAPAKVDVATLRIRRDDPAEKWFVMSLLHVEPEIDERTDAMVFSVYARGRVNPPAIGTGISEEELERQVRFVLGPCACTIKHDNPGMDLALVADWDAIALAMAKKHGSETGNEQLLGDVPGLFPEILGPDTSTSNQPPASPQTDAAASEQPNTNAVAAAETQPSASQTANADSPPPSMESRAEAASDPALLRNVGIGVLVGVVLLAAASFALLRRPA
jgi:hypothetical protein